MFTMLADSNMTSALLTAGALGVACALMSVFVVLRHWAFLGEGIAHSSFGGAGVAWMLAILFPALAPADIQFWLVPACVILFCLLTAGSIGYLSNRHRLHFDATVGIFLVASLAWGFLAQHAYVNQFSANPWGYNSIILGELLSVSRGYAWLTVGVCSAVLIIIWLLWKEILSYCFDHVAARVGGVRTTFIHYLMVMVVAVLIIVGVRVVGSLLVTAMLVLPGVIAILLSKRMSRVVMISIISGLVGSLTGMVVHHHFRFIPAGPAIVLVLFAFFLAALLASRVRANA